MRSVWLCSRNDALLNTAVMLAAVGVVGTGTIWPDVGVAALLAGLGLLAARHIVGQARQELAAQRATARDDATRAIPIIDD